MTEEFLIIVYSSTHTNNGFNTSSYFLNSGGFFSTEVLPDSVFNLHIEYSDTDSMPHLSMQTNMNSNSSWVTFPNNDTITADFSWTPSINNVARQPYSIVVRGLPAGNDLVYLVYVKGNYNDSCSSVISVPEILNETDINIYPNPSSSYLTVEINGNKENFICKILSIDGRLIFSDSISNNQNTISPSRLNAGLYVLNISNKNSVVNKIFSVY